MSGKPHSLSTDRGFGRKTHGSLEVISGHCCSGFGHKTFGSLEVDSRYSQPPRIVKLTPHHVSLHTQAHEMYYQYFKPPASAGRPVAMRESRTSIEDSGNQLAQNPTTQTQSHSHETHSSQKEKREETQYRNT